MKALTYTLDKRLTLRLTFKYILTTSSNVKVFARSDSGFLTVTCELSAFTTTPQFCDSSIPFKGRTRTATRTDDIFMSRMSIILCKWYFIRSLCPQNHKCPVTHLICFHEDSHLEITLILDIKAGEVILYFTVIQNIRNIICCSWHTGKACRIQRVRVKLAVVNIKYTANPSGKSLTFDFVPK